MNGPGFAAFAPGVIGSGVLFLVFGYLWTLYRERALGLWTVAWGLWTLRRTWALFAESLMFDRASVFLVALVLSYVTLALMATSEFTERPMSRIWYGIVAGTLIVGLAVGDPPILLTTAVVAAGWFWAGTLLLTAKAVSGPARMVPALGMILMAVATLRIPLVGDAPAHVAWGNATVFAIQSLIAIGILLLVHEREQDRLEAAQLRRDAALTRALSGYVPVCEGCKSVHQGGDAWVTMESFLGGRAAVAVSHSICPDCMRKLYPDFADGD